MITRTLIVIAVIIVPYLLGMIQTVEFLNTFPTYLKGIYYMIFLTLVFLVVYGIYAYIMHGKP